MVCMDGGYHPPERRRVSQAHEELGATGAGPATSDDHDLAETRLVDQAIDRYVDWREASALVRCSYDVWCGAPWATGQRPFDVYRVALDLEEWAATRYAEAVGQLTRFIIRERELPRTW